MRVASSVKSGPYAPLALRYLLQNPGEFELVSSSVGTRRVRARPDHRCMRPSPASCRKGGSDLPCDLSRIVCLRTCDVNDSGVVAGLAKQAHRSGFGVRGFRSAFFSHPFACRGAGFIKRPTPSPLPLLRGPPPIFWARLKQGRRENRLSPCTHGRKEPTTGDFCTDRFCADAARQRRSDFSGRRKSGRPLLRTLLNRPPTRR